MQTDSAIMAGEHFWISTILLVPLISFTVAQNLLVVAPNTFRLGASETVAVFVTQGVRQYELFLQDYPGMKNTFSRLKVTVQENDPQVLRMRVNPENIPDLALSPPSTKHYVLLVAEGRNFRTETKVLVSLHSGYLFVQTDKPMYTPDQTAHIRIFQLNEDMHLDRGNFTVEIRNPEDVIVEEKLSNELNGQNGLYSHSFSLAPTAMVGEWSLVVKYGHKVRRHETVIFEVKKYSLPTYKVTIKAPEVVLPTTGNVEIEIEAKYVYGKDVDGTTKCKFSVLSRTMEKIYIGSTHGRMLRDGKAKCNISRERFEVRWFPELNNFRLIVEAEVTERATGQKENATSTSTVFSQTKYLVDFKRALKDFRPGFFTTAVAVITVASGKVAPNVDARIEVKDQNGKCISCKSHDRSDEEGLVSFLIPTTTAVKQLYVTIVTEDKQIGENLQGISRHVMLPSTSNSYVHLERSSISQTLKVGRKFTSTFHANPDNIAVSYVLTSGGRIVDHGFLAAGNFQGRILQFRISDFMVPSVRITLIAVHNGATMVDSIKIDVEKQCQVRGKITLESSDIHFIPGGLAKFTLHGASGTVVGIQAVDKTVYSLRDKGTLTNEKMYSKMQEHDLGCGPGGGLDPGLVLANAGLLILTDTSTIAPEPPSCTERKMQKRDLQEDIHSSFDTDGRLYKGINKKLQFEPDYDERQYKYYTPERNYIPETWLFESYVIGESNRKDLILTVPHDITTWMIQAVGISPNHGMCVADPVEAVTFKNIFVQLKFPHSVVRKEQIDIRTTVFNYGATRQTVTVYMYGVEGICSEAPPNPKGEGKKIYVPGNGGAETVTFLVVPLEIGKFSIKVVALSTDESDTIVKELNVVAEGIPHVENIVVEIDPSNVRKRNGDRFYTNKSETHIVPGNWEQISVVSLTPEQDFIEGTDSCIITAIGENFGPVVQTVLNNPDKLIQIPTGNGEEIMDRFGPALYTLHYLKVTGKLTPEQETKAYEHVRDGYTKEITFRKPDGSYGASLENPSSTWLTAFVAKVFCQASKYVFIDENYICTALNWLAKQQDHDGSFIEDSPVLHHEMMDGFDGVITTTAFVTITLYKCQCGQEILHEEKEKAVNFLTKILPDVTHPYQLSIVAYALSLSDPTKANFDGNKRLLDLSNVNQEQNTRHWGDSGTAFSIETASYALLTQLLYGNLDIAGSIVNWMNTQRTAYGEFSSTQETVIVLEALAEYAIYPQNPAMNLAGFLKSSVDKKFDERFKFNTANSRVLRSFKLNQLKGELYLYAEGTGVGTLGVQLRYNVPTKLDETCKFEIDVKVTEAEGIIKPQKRSVVNAESMDEFSNKTSLVEQEFRSSKQHTSAVNHLPLAIVDVRRPKRFAEPKISNSVYVANISICVKYLSNRNSNKAIVDTGIFTGFTPNKSDLDMIVSDTSVPVENYEETGRSIVFYFDYIPHANPVCFWFRATRKYIVGNKETSTIEVFDYFIPEHPCTVFYSPDPDSARIQTVCTDKVCKCAEGGCAPEAPFEEILNSMDVDWQQQQLLEAICDDSDYAWRVLVVKIDEDSSSFMTVNVKVLSVLREGRESRVSFFLEPERQFLLRKSCKTGHLEVRKMYIIMGADPEPTTREDGEHKYTYLINRQTRIFESFYVYGGSLKKTRLEKNLQRSFKVLEDVLTKEGCLY